MTRTRKKRKEPTAFVGAYITPELKAQVEAIALKEERPVSWVIKNFLLLGVAHLEGKKA